MKTVTIEIAVDNDLPAEPVHLLFDGKPVAKMSAQAAARLAANLLDAVQLVSMPHG